jgi:hypothetical protein
LGVSFSFLKVILMSADVAKWPVPEVLTGRTYVYLASVHWVNDITDIYIDTDETGYQSIIFADRWSTENNTFGSMPLDCFLDSYTSDNSCSKRRREILWHILRVGKLHFSPKEVSDSEDNG